MRRSSMSRLSVFLSLFLMLCSATALQAQDQANEIVCSSTTACKSGFIPVFSTNGGSAKVSNSLLTQSGSTVSLNANETLSGNLTAGGSVSGSGGIFSGNVGLTGYLSMAQSTATAGNLLKGGSLFLHNFGVNNTFLGQNAGNLTMAVSANNNTAVGTNALSNNTTACCNTATGNNVLLHNTTGGSNTGIGEGALYSNTTGGNNTAAGRWALISNSIGNNNTAFGVTALRYNTTGVSNTATGFQALYNNCSDPASCSNSLAQGSENTALGYNALYSNDAGSGSTAIGAHALQNTVGYPSANTAVGDSALLSNTNGFSNTAIGNFADVSSGSLTNATAIGADAVVDASNKIRLGNGSVTVIEGQVPYTYTSDRNQKENFRPVDGEQVLKKILGLSLTSWNYIGHDAKQFRHYGPVAQEFYAAFGHDGVGTVGNDTTINSGDLDGVLTIAVQTLEKHVEELESLKAENADLKARLERLERATPQLVSLMK